MKNLKEGFTTGSCAAAAALAACMRRRDGICPERVSIVVPAGKTYAPEIIAHEDGTCGVLKYSGDDPDITNSMEVIAGVEILEENGPVIYRGGAGVGIVTEPGLKIPVGEPAINPVPRQMIEDAVRSVYGPRGAIVTITLPKGEELAKRTFNPRLGIKGGLSILGTSGIVRPMSEEALKASLYEELKMRSVQGCTSLIFTFGNQGERALAPKYPEYKIVQVSNEIGFMLDSALELGIKHLILGGHSGKMTKIAAGIMQTHSHTADGRREAIITRLAMMQAPLELMQKVDRVITTDAAGELIHEYGYDGVWDLVAEAARKYAELRVRGGILIDTIITDTPGNIIGSCIR